MPSVLQVGDHIRVTTDVNSLVEFGIDREVAEVLAGRVVALAVAAGYDLGVACPLNLRQTWYLSEASGHFARTQDPLSPPVPPFVTEAPAHLRVGTVVTTPSRAEVEAAGFGSTLSAYEDIYDRERTILAYRNSRIQVNSCMCGCDIRVWLPAELFDPPDPLAGMVSTRPPRRIRKATITPLPRP